MRPDSEPVLAERLLNVRRAVEAAARRGARPAGSVRLVAVTKTIPPDAVRKAWELGLRDFGESYVQEALGKVDRLPADIRWHFIGRLQSNKAKQAVELFTLIHSLDRPSLAEALEKAARARGIRLDVLIQVNSGGEDSKAGATAEGAIDLARRAGEWPSLRLRGLMAIPPYFPDPERVRPHFRALRELGERIRALGIPGVSMEELSMGMSGDFEVAVEEGATVVRVGTAIFGDRPAERSAD